MLFNYKTLTEQLTDYLSENYPSVTKKHTDIFERAFLRFLGYHSVPKKCYFKESQDKINIFIHLKTPYKVSNSKFFDDLQICITNKFSAININAIEPERNDGFSIFLSVSYIWLRDYMPKILRNINTILSDLLKLNFTVIQISMQEKLKTIYLLFIFNF